MSGRPPDYRVSLGVRDEKGSTTIGAAWTNKAGGINIKLNPGLRLQIDGSVELSLWPPKDGARRGGGGPGPEPSFPADSMDDSDIPFVVNETLRGGRP